MAALQRVQKTLSCVYSYSIAGPLLNVGFHSVLVVCVCASTILMTNLYGRLLTTP